MYKITNHAKFHFQIPIPIIEHNFNQFQFKNFTELKVISVNVLFLPRNYRLKQEISPTKIFSQQPC